MKKESVDAARDRTNPSADLHSNTSDVERMREALETARRIVLAADEADARGRETFYPDDAISVARALLVAERSERVDTEREMVPCPWCETSEFLHIVVETSRDKKRAVPIVACGKCATGGPKPFCLAIYDDHTGMLTDACQEKAWAAWNRRALAAAGGGALDARTLEAAAKVAEEFSAQHAPAGAIYFQGIEDASRHIAAAIRSLKQEGGR